MASSDNPFNATDKFLYNEFCNKIESFKNSNCLKNKDKSTDFRQKGNNFFAKNQLEDALIYFVKAIRYGPDSSPELSFAYGNKSAVLYKLKNYRESIECIDVAIKYDYPKDKLKKLIERKNNCINKLKDSKASSKDQKQIESQDTTNLSKQPKRLASSDINESSDEKEKSEKYMMAKEESNTQTDHEKKSMKEGFVENCIEIDWLSSDLNELGVKSKRTLAKGELILYESPFVNSLHKDNYNDYCYLCFKKLTFESQFPCRNCVQVNLCSLDCESINWNRYHRIECGYIDLYQMNELLEHHTKICSKLFCSLFIQCELNKERMINCIKQSTKKSGRKLEKNYSSFAQLIEHPNQDKNNYSLISLLLIAFFNTRFKAESKSLFKSFFSEAELILIKSTIEKHIRQIQVNALMITDTDKKKNLRSVPMRVHFSNRFPLSSL